MNSQHVIQDEIASLKKNIHACVDQLREDNLTYIAENLSGDIREIQRDFYEDAQHHNSSAELNQLRMWLIKQMLIALDTALLLIPKDKYKKYAAMKNFLCDIQKKYHIKKLNVALSPYKQIYNNSLFRNKIIDPV